MCKIKRWASTFTPYSNGASGAMYIEYVDGKIECMQYDAVYGYGNTKRRDTTERQACAIAASRLPSAMEVTWEHTMQLGYITHAERILGTAMREQREYEMST